MAIAFYFILEECLLDVGRAVGNLRLTFASRPEFNGFAVGVDLSASMIARAVRWEIYV